MAPSDPAHRAASTPSKRRSTTMPAPGADGGGGATLRPAGFGRPAEIDGLPDGLHVVERAPAGGWGNYRGPVVVLVHGALDRAGSFARTARRLPEWAVVAYDRRGYQGSRAAGVARDVATHADDLLAIVAAYGEAGGPVTVVGHSVGGTVAVAAALKAPGLVASVGAYEPSMAWLGFRGVRPDDRPSWGKPAEEAERFFRRMAGDGAWERLTPRGRATRRADGPALVSDLAGLRGAAPFDVTALRVPALFAVGGAASADHHRRSVAWLAEHVPGAQYVQIQEAGHGAHLSHPDRFALVVRQTVALAGEPAGASAR